jgi:hypothetical protein
MPIVATPSTNSGLAELILEIRDLIPDPVTDASQDGNAFSLATLLRFVNHAGEELCFRAPVIEDWYGVPSEAAMDVYEMANIIVDVRQLWYDLWPCWRAPEYDGIFTTKISSRSYFFGPHASHQIPKIHVWPCADRSAATTTLTAPITSTALVIPVTNSTGFKAFGLLKIEDEIILYRTLDGTTNIRQTLRGQGGTTAMPHALGATVQELNIMMKVSRLPKPVTTINDIFEIPQGLYPLVEMEVLAHVRQIEQEFQESQRLHSQFDQEIEKIANKGNKIRQGIQIRAGMDGPLLYGHTGRVIVP